MKVNVKRKNSNLYLIAILSFLLVIAMGISATLAYFTDEGTIIGTQDIAFGTIDLQSLNDDLPSNGFTWSSGSGTDIYNFFPGDSVSVDGGIKSESTGDFYVYIKPYVMLEKKVGSEWVNLGEVYQGVMDAFTESYRAPSGDELLDDTYKAFDMEFVYRGLNVIGTQTYLATNNGWTNRNADVASALVSNGETMYEVNVTTAGNLAHGEATNATIEQDSDYVHSIHMTYNITLKEDTPNVVYYTMGGSTFNALSLNDINSRGTDGNRNYRLNFSIDFRAIQKRNFYEGAGAPAQNNAVPDVYQVNGVGTKDYNDVFEYLAIEPIFTGEYNQWNLKYDSDDNGTLDADCWSTMADGIYISNAYYNYLVSKGITSVFAPGYMLTAGRYMPVQNLSKLFLNARDSIQSVTIGTGVQSISDTDDDEVGAFMSCTSLSTINFPKTLTSIGKCAFDNCSALTSITLPSNLSAIGEYAFSSTALQNVVIPNSVTSIGAYAFGWCQTLQSVTLPFSITTIPTSAFRNCKVLNNVVIPNGVTRIGDNAFNGCTNLSSITIPNSVTSIGDGAFNACTSLTNIALPNSLTTIEMGAFNASGLLSVVIPNSVTNIETNAFRGCPLTNGVTFGTGLTKLVGETFSYAGFTTITIPSTIKRIEFGGDGALFKECPNLQSIIFEDGCEYIDGLCSWCPNLTNVQLPNTVTYISEISGNEALETITIPNSVTSIGTNCFSGCTSLTSLVIPDSVTTIGKRMLAGCQSLQSLTVPFLGLENYQTALTWADPYLNASLCILFGNSPLSETLYNVCEIDEGPDSSGRYVDYENPYPYDYNNDKMFYIPISFTNLTITSQCTHIWDLGLFYGENINVSFPSTIEYIGDVNYFNESQFISGENYIGKCFVKYNGVMPENTTITLQNDTTQILRSAFSGYTNLKGITIPNSVTSIEGWAFNGCTGLTSITIPNTLTSIGGYAFSGCTGLASITIPDSVQYIGLGALYGCTGITSLEIPFIGSSTAPWRAGYWQTVGWVFNNANNGLRGDEGGNSSMPASLTTLIVGGNIREYSIFGCQYLTTIVIKNATTIDLESFNSSGYSILANVYVNTQQVATGLTSASAMGNLIANATSIYLMQGLTAPSYLVSAGTTNTFNGVIYNRYTKSA